MKYNPNAAGKVVRRLREQSGMTQELLSGFAGIARSHLSMIENGSKQPNFETIWRIAVALDMAPSKLVEEIEKEIQL